MSALYNLRAPGAMRHVLFRLPRPALRSQVARGARAAAPLPRCASSSAAAPASGAGSSAAAAQTASARQERAACVLSNLSSSADVEDYALVCAALSSPGSGSGSGSGGGGGGGGGGPLLPAGVRPLAVVKVGGEVIATAPMLAAFAASLRGLREHGLTPVVVHGGGPQLNDELARAGVRPEYIGGAFICAARLRARTVSPPPLLSLSPRLQATA